MENYGGTREFNFDEIIRYLESTTEDSWCTDVVKTKDGKNCLLGHLFDFGGNKVMDIFESLIATTFMFYPVNDGTNKMYQQETPKQRIIAYLKDIREGKQPSTEQLMQIEYENYEQNNLHSRS